MQNSKLSKQKLLIFGLGNNGKEYQKTRHNFGHFVVAKLLEKDLFNNLVIIKTNDRFMNDCGVSLKKLVDYYKIEPANVLVIHDDMDFEFGDVKLDYNRSSAGHHGVESVISNIKTQAFHRLRLGIGKSSTKPGDVFVLEIFSVEEENKILEVIDKAVNLLVESDLLKDNIK